MISWHLPSLRLFCLLLSGFWQNSTIIWCLLIRSGIIFTGNKEIRNQLGVWKSKCRKDIPSEEQYREQCKLLELMANDLGYKDKITWDIIQNPYYPEGLNQQLTMNTQIMNGQVEWAKAAGLLSQMMGKPQQNSEDTDHANT